MEEAKFVLSKGKVIEQFNKVKGLADIVSYSSKTNQHVTKILEEETNSLFSVHLSNELQHIKDKSRALFLAQGWTEKEIRGLVEQGINFFVVDNEPDLDTLLGFLKGSNARVSLLLRAKLKELTLRTERHFVFGMKSQTINRRVKEIRADKEPSKRIKTLGIHFHRKTQNMSEWNLKYEVQHMLEPQTLEAIDLVNIGGGIPSEYANTNVDVLPTIFKKIGELRHWLNQQNIKLMVEPGRFIAAPAAKLVTSIIGIYENNVVVNASVYNSDLDTLIVPVKLLIEGELPKGKGKPYAVKGITPCSMDLFRYRVYLRNPKVGQKLVFLNAGAYNFHTNFCDLEELKTEIVE
jgi:ornithine decarboxylase